MLSVFKIKDIFEKRKSQPKIVERCCFLYIKPKSILEVFKPKLKQWLLLHVRIDSKFDE